MLEEDGRLRNLRAENYILNQRISAEWIYASEEWKKEARQFCVKGLAEIDMLTEIQAKLEEAQRKGLGLRQFKKKIVPYLQQKGWLGGDEKEIGHRIRIIFDTNLASARASAKWQKIQETKDKMPYLQYLPSLSADKRDEHKAFYGLIARADDEIWQRIFPPNGYNCKCRTRQLTEREAQRLIKEQEENGGRIVASDELINKAVDSSFQHNHEDLSGFFGYIENQKITKEEREHGKTSQQKKKENLILSIALKKNLLVAASPVKNHFELLKDGDTLLNGYEKLVKEIEKGNFNNGFHFCEAIFKREDVAISYNFPFYFPVGNEKEALIINEALNHFPYEIMKKMDSKGGRVFFLPYLPEDARASYKHAILFDDLTDFEAKAIKANVVNVKNLKGDEGNFNSLLDLSDGLISISKNERSIGTIGHEWTHRIRYTHYELQKLFQDYFEYITADKSKPENNPQRLKDIYPLLDYDSDEKAIQDDFFDAYFGKIDGKNNARELLTMCYEALLGDDYELFYNLSKKPQLFGFALASLVRFGKTRKQNERHS